MRLLLMGANYKRTPLEWREALTLTRSERETVVPCFKAIDPVKEVLILQTCNRVEFYFGLDGDTIPTQIQEWLANRTGVSWSALSESLDIDWDLAVVGHLFRVAAGLDSMVLGEEQILGQVREAYLTGMEMGGVSTYFHQLWSEALRVGKQVRTETGISQSGISISTAAVEWVKEFCPEIPTLKAVVLGAGEMGQLALASLYDAGVRDLLVINRNEERGGELARRFGGRLCSWAQKQEAIQMADVVITATSAPHYVITQKDVIEVKPDRLQPLLIIDLAVPRDVEPGVADWPGVRVCHVDDLQEKAMELHPTHRDVVTQALVMVEREVEVFAHWLRLREAIPVIRALREKGEAIRQQELERVKMMLQRFNEREQELIQEVTQKIVARLLHEPTVQLKELVQSGGGEDYLSLICRLYNLPWSSQGE